MFAEHVPCPKALSLQRCRGCGLIPQGAPEEGGDRCMHYCDTEKNAFMAEHCYFPCEKDLVLVSKEFTD